ncbi:hypothetical protein [Rhodovulum sp. 12E13]|uniref:hypothetical protein n=1 Tax=Rhodovulum sp. 12E13 TaxID=2203891 RepID=UPI0011C059D3|nr:hypothetical protein [Rhodovulum sp. 12E13]
MGDARAAHIAPPTIPQGLAALGLVALAAGPAGATPFVEAWHDATIAGCLPALERGETIDGRAMGLMPAPDIALGYAAPTETWRHPDAPFLLGAVTLPGPAGERRLCDVLNSRILSAETINAVYSDFLDWAEAVQDARRYSFVGTRYDDDWLTGVASLRSRFATHRHRGLEVTFVAQPPEGRVTFSAVETILPEDE